MILTTIDKKLEATRSPRAQIFSILHTLLKNIHGIKKDRWIWIFIDVSSLQFVLPQITPLI